MQDTTLPRTTSRFLKMTTSGRVASIASLLVSASLPVGAQELHGIVVDSASRRPIASAVLVLTDETGTARGRTITNDRGFYRLPPHPDARSVRVLRLGFRARELRIPSPTDGTLDIAMVAIPTLLENVTVQAARACPRRDDARSALALLEQARAGLLATVVAAESNPATMKLLRYERWMEGTSDRILRQKVHIDSVASRKKSFEAATSAAAFVRDGFSADSAGSRILYGPDAEVLLDDSFANAYCFRLVDADAAHPHQVALGFAPAEHKRDRVDIEGAVWVDTVARRLADIDFRYVGLKLPYNAPTPGGHIHFHEMPNGMVVIQSWVLTLATATQDTSGDFRHPLIRQHFSGNDVGGEVARAVWADGRAWEAPLGTVQLHVVTGEGEPTNRVAIRLGESDYSATPDARGDLEIRDVLPGPYVISIIDTSVAAAGTVIDSPLRIVGQRDSVVRALVVTPPTEAFLRRRCSNYPQFTWVTATVTKADESPAIAAVWEVGEAFGTSWETVYARGSTGHHGTFGFCSELSRDATLQLRVSDGLEPRREVLVMLTSRSERVKVTLPARSTPPAAPR